MTDRDLMWLAGILEGEGTFGLYRDQGYLRARIQVESSDKDVVERIARLFGGYAVIPNKKKSGHQIKTQYRTKVTGAQAIYLMEKLHPLMGIRRGRKISTILRDVS